MSQSSNIEVAKLTTQLKPSIVSGLSLDESMKKTGMFEYDTLAKIEAGRSSGSLTDTLDMLASKIKKSMELKQKLISSLTYPCFMVVMLVAVLILMLTIIVPNIGETIKQLGGEMPELTLIIMGASDFLVDYGLFILGGLAAVIGLHIYLMKNIKAYRFLVHTFLYYIPLIGPMLMKVHLQTFANTLSQLLSSGVTIANALQISVKTIPNLKMRDAVQKASYRVAQDGYDVYSAFESTKFFPLDFVQMIMIGSHSGNLDGILTSIADQYAKDVEETLKRITALVEPIAILATAAIGGVCVIAMYLPMFSVFESI
jgi:type IV pilus assembly protein PilC